MITASNPVIKGFYPDPSVCRVGEDYYLVNSTFSYVPGVPVFHSRDLVNWEQIGNILERREQLVLDGARMSQGIYAPTIRYHNGIFYMITTNVNHGGNFYVTAEDPAGPWSDPVYLKKTDGVDQGIDPSLFFEGDKCYYVGQRQKKNARCFGDCEIWIQELDLLRGELTGEITPLYDGAMKDAEWVEGPHLYKIGDYYYIMAAEQGTGYEHSLSMARSKTLRGPYKNNICNPILTHRHLGRRYPIQCIGHGDLVDTPDGRWYMVMLGTRPVNGAAELGRETFLAEVEWENGWPVVNPGEGKIRERQSVHLEEMPVKNPAWQPKIELCFDGGLDKRILFFKQPAEDLYRFESKNEVSLKMLPYVPESDESCAYMALRQQDRNFTVSAEVKAEFTGNEEAGLMYLHDDYNYIKLTISKIDGALYVRADKTEKRENEEEVKKICLGGFYLPEKEPADKELKEEKPVTLTMKGSGQEVSLYANERAAALSVPVRFLSSEHAGGFIGATFGIYASGNGTAGMGRVYFKNICISYDSPVS